MALTTKQRVTRTSRRIQLNPNLTAAQKAQKLAFQQSRLPAGNRLPGGLPRFDTTPAAATPDMLAGWTQEAQSAGDQQYGGALMSLAQQLQTAQLTGAQNTADVERNYTNAYGDLTKAFQAQRNAAPEEYNLRGLYNSGIMGDALAKIGTAYQGDVGKLNAAKTADLTDIMSNLSLLGNQLGEKRTQMTKDQGGYIQNVLEQMKRDYATQALQQMQYGNELKQNQFTNRQTLKQNRLADLSRQTAEHQDQLAQDRWQQEMAFKKDQTGFENNLAVQKLLADMAGGGAGGGGRGGSGGGGGSTPYWGSNVSAKERAASTRANNRADLVGRMGDFIGGATSSAMGRLRNLMATPEYTRLTARQKDDLREYANAVQFRLNKKKKKK